MRLSLRATVAQSYATFWKNVESPLVEVVTPDTVVNAPASAAAPQTTSAPPPPPVIMESKVCPMNAMRIKSCSL